MPMETRTRFIENPGFSRLGREEAIKNLRHHILELEEQKGKELTEKQIAALIKFTKGLISSIETETKSSHLDKEWHGRWFGENNAKDSQLKWLRYIFTM